MSQEGQTAIEEMTEIIKLLETENFNSTEDSNFKHEQSDNC